MPLFSYELKQSEEHDRQFIGSSQSPRRCRFCHQSEPSATFKKLAHVIPDAFGNRKLFSNEECDSCNAKFGRELDNDLATMLYPERILGRLKGAKDMTKYRPFNGKSYALGSTNSKAIKLVLNQEEQFFQLVQTGNNSMDLKIKLEPFSPANAIRNLARMAIAVAPETELANLQPALDWVNKNREWQPLYYHGFIAGPGLDLVVLDLLKVDLMGTFMYEVTFIFSSSVYTLQIPGPKGLTINGPLHPIYWNENSWGPTQIKAIKIINDARDTPTVTLGINYNASRPIDSEST